VRLVPDVELKRAGEIAYREVGTEAGESQGPLPVLLLHGYPETSFMWRDLMSELATSGRRAIAPDLPGYGDSPLTVDGTWESHVDAIERFRNDLELERVALMVHDWGGLIGMRWACDHPRAVGALVLSGTGFFPDGKWHGLGEALRTEGAGEAVVDAIERDGFAAMLRQTGRGFDDDAIEEYWKAYATEEQRRAQLALYRSGDFVKLAPYEGRLAELGIPTLILWGEGDTFAPVGGAYRFHRQIPDSKLVLVEDAGHFVFEDDPGRCAREVVGFLDESEV
jgi:haloalkane dehalogenase